MSYLKGAVGHRGTHKSVWAAHGHVLVWVAPHAVLWWVGGRGEITACFVTLHLFFQWSHVFSSTRTSTVPCSTVVPRTVCALPMAMHWCASHLMWFCGGLDREVTLALLCNFAPTVLFFNGHMSSAQLVPQQCLVPPLSPGQCVRCAWPCTGVDHTSCGSVVGWTEKWK